VNRKTAVVAATMMIGLGLLLVTGYARAGDPEHYADKNMRLAAKDAGYGFDELDKMAAKLDMDEQKSALHHFEWAIDDFEEAVAHLTKAVLGKEYKDIATDLKNGLDALKKAEKSLENGNIEDAQKHFDNAQENFNRAEAVLETSN